MEQETKIPLHLLTTSGFDAEFFQLLGKDEVKTMEDAYLILEKKYAHAFGKTRYSNYESYRKARDYRLKRK